MHPFYRGCGSPQDWTDITQTSWDYTYASHLAQSPSTPYAILESQGGALDPWGVVGLDMCAAKISPEFARVFQKELVARGIRILILYIIFGGTNSGNMGHPEGYTSYDHGAFIREGRRVGREMFSEMKLQSRWLTASKGYLSAVPQPATHAFMDTAEIITTPVLGNKTRFYITRHADSTSEEDTKYRLPVPTMYANLTIPLLGGDLILRGRDSKIHVTHYDVGGIDLVCSSAEIYTWKKYKERKRVLILYGSEGESHEFALPGSLGEPMVQGTHVNVCNKSGLVIVNRQVQPSRRVVEFNGLTVFLLWRNQACNYRVLGLPDAETGTIPFVETESSLIINGGYLSRNATLNHDRLHLTGDINATTEFEVIGGVSTDVSVFFNGKKLNTTKQSERLKTVAKFHKPILRLPDLSTLPWMKLDSVPELSDTSSDRDWTKASLDKTANTSSNWSTPTSLFSGDYGYHSGSLLFRGHFTASGNETDFNITMQGGAAPGSSVWLGDVFLGSFYGDAHAANQIMFLSLPALESGHGYVLTILMDNMGYDMNFYVESDAMKAPRGGLAYSLSGHDDADITWKITSNLGGEDYLDKVRGPYNEGAMYAERKRFHLPSALMNAFEHGSPYDGLNSAGVAFYTTTFGLQTPDGFDIPLSFVFDPSGQAEGFNYRVQLFVNGYQFGKYVPEEILNYQGENSVAITLWALDASGAKLNGFKLEAAAIFQSGYKKPGVANFAGWEERTSAY